MTASFTEWHIYVALAKPCFHCVKGSLQPLKQPKIVLFARSMGWFYVYV